ncbi:hypothetical protein [Paraflavitalea sp. CAU 1676]|uniref:hypothetical protein n=1 Tax=Paraflavitalea sp. CAU 1676 TaxID=3032598 RepID=UPI0023DBF05E|nr:hypothetical protein [Paraflavitalea sp. CAU 1676]MDF2189271.1 hypothetical protein [Paraflavitalea sp. CAU 1676]
MSKKDNTKIIVVGLMGLLVLIGFFAFLFSTSEYSSYTHTYKISGLEVVKNESAWFWVFVLLGGVVGGGCICYSHCLEAGVGPGKNKNPSDWAPIAWFAAGILLIICPWIPAFGHKANGGVDFIKKETVMIRSAKGAGKLESSIIYIGEIIAP